MLIAVCMLLQIFGISAFADVQQGDPFTKHYANDSFTSGTDGWIVGESPEGYEATISVVEDEGATDGKALKMTFPAKGPNLAGGDKYAVYGSVTKQGIGNGTEFSLQNELTIKARVKKTDSAMSFQLKGNRPNTIEQIQPDNVWVFYYNLFDQLANANGIGLSGSGLQQNGGSGGKYGWHENTVPNGTKVDLTGKWVEYTLRFVPADKKYYVTIKYTDTDGTEKTLATNQTGNMRASELELLKEYGNDFPFDHTVYQYFGGLKSLTFTSRTAGDIYVDYVEIYGTREHVATTASLESSAVSPSGQITVNFTGEEGAKIPVFPDGVVTLKGQDDSVIECVVTPDLTNQKITLKPINKLTPGETVTVVVDDELFLSGEGVIVNSETEFDVEVQYAQATAQLISDTTIEAGDSVTVKINSFETITDFPEGLVTIKDAENNTVPCRVAPDVDTQTVTLKPVNAFTAGGAYTVNINTDILQTECGSILEGAYSFPFSISPLSVFGVAINGKPAPEVTVGVAYTFEGVHNEGAHIFHWQTAATADATEWETLQNGTSPTYTFGYDLSHGCYVRVIMTPVDTEGNIGRSVTTAPVMFKFVPSEDEDGLLFRKYYVNDDYNTAGDVGNWKVGETKALAGQTVTVTQENLVENGETVGAMKFFAYKNDSGYTSDQQPYADNDFTDIPFNTNSKIVIETRIKALGGYLGNTESMGSWAGLKFNRPNQAKYLVENANINYRGWNGGTLFLIKHDSGLRYKNNSYQDAALDESDYRDKWVNVKIVIDGTDGNMQDYTITVTDDNGLNVTQTAGTLKEQQTAMYDVPSAVDSFIYNAKSQHTDLRNLSLVLRNYADTVYLDYFKVYEVRSAQTATVSFPNGTSIRPADSIKVKFNGSVGIEEFAEGLITVDGVECDVTSDIDEQTVTLTPKQKLTPNSSYTLKVSSKILADSVGFVLEGQKEFTINVTDVNVYNVITTGRVVTGTEMGVEYTYDDSPVFEGTHLYQWQKSLNGIDWVNIDGQTAPTYTVTQDIYDNEYYVRVVMTPVDENGKPGLVTNGGYVHPETAPVLDSVMTNTTMLFPDVYVTPVYTYIDPNEDKIVTKTVNWYSSTSADGPWTLESTDENYLVKETDLGKYFKFDIKITNDGPRKNESTVYESGAVGPVADIVESTNLLINAGFERGDLRGWDTDDGIIELAGAEGARTGNYAVHLMPRAGNSDNWPQKVENLTLGKSYILSGYVKNSNPDLPNVTNFWPYTWGGLSRVGGNDYSYLVGAEWIQATGAFRASATTASVDFVSFHSMNADCYLDDLYFGELIIADIETFTPDATEIPTAGTVKLPITSGKILNQVGTTHGLTGEKIEVRLPEGTSGITLEGNNLVIDSSAVAGTYVVEVYCEPTYPEAAQLIYQEFITVELLPNNDGTPKARNVKATGNVAERSKLKGSYEYYQINGIANNSSVKWVYSDSYDGTYRDIPGATSTTYTVEAAYADKFIKFAVIPKTVEGVEGTITYSNVLTNPRAPFATDVTVSGDFKVGGTLTASYTYNDYNNIDNAKDEEGATTFQWYVSDTADSAPTPIAGANQATYTLTSNEIDKYISVGVTPVSKVEPTTGVEVKSTGYFGPTAPTAINVTFSRNGLNLIGSYNYNHAHGARETDSVYEWRVNGVLVSNSINYTINFEGTKYVEFSVTPVGDTNPSTGAAYKFGANIAGTSTGGSTGGTGGGGGGGTGGGGGGGGAVGSTGVTNINDMKIPEQEVKEPEKPQPKSDLDGHWGEVYVKEMEERGVMKADEKGNYDPDRIVSRSEMISYLFDALKLEEAEYSAEFSDVSALDDYAGKLQAMINNGTIASYHEFRPTDGISRQEMCKILYVSLENAGKLTKSEENILDVFTDKDLVADWAIDYVNTIYSNKIMIGTSDTTFAPTENITRAQVATMLVRILNVIEG